MRPTDAIVTGFTKNAELYRRAFAPLQELKQRGVLRGIRYVTWDSAEIDGFIAPLDGVDIVRVPQPHAEGNGSRRGFVYQTRNLDAALAQVPDDALVVKLRPDFVFRTEFLESKLRGFERLCATRPNAKAFGHQLPRTPFERKIWIPWADANQPFFYEDAAFIGLKSDLKKLIAPDLGRAEAILAQPTPGSLVHVLRYIYAFLPRFPVFRRYIEEYAGFANDLSYRQKLVGMLLEDGFFWHLIVAHAWILWTSFHVDCGEAGDLAFHPNTVNADWSSFDKLKLAPPYDRIAMWRQGTCAGEGVLPALMRVYGRLMDDAWADAFFTRTMNDIPPGMPGRLAQGVARQATGYLAAIEDAFYAKLRAFHAERMRDAA
jgi:hypothetical protein